MSDVYVGFHEYAGEVVPVGEAFEYAKDHLDELTDDEKQGFVDWFFSGNFIKRGKE